MSQAGRRATVPTPHPRDGTVLCTSYPLPGLVTCMGRDAREVRGGQRRLWEDRAWLLKMGRDNREQHPKCRRLGQRPGRGQRVMGRWAKGSFPATPVLGVSKSLPTRSSPALQPRIRISAHSQHHPPFRRHRVPTGVRGGGKEPNSGIRQPWV